MSNIAEGFERHTQVLFIKHLGYTRGSAAEVRSQLYVAMDRRYIPKDKFDEAYNLADKAARQITRFMSYLESNPNSRRVREGQIYYNVEI
jgi:four helix bundle protein